jgi:rubrerythrin
MHLAVGLVGPDPGRGSHLDRPGVYPASGSRKSQKPNPSQLAMLSTMPIKLDKVKKDDLDKQILRAALIAELDAITLYEQLASMTDNEKLKTVLLDVAKEEKTHVGEFQALLKRLDPNTPKNWSMERRKKYKTHQN